MTVFVDGKHPVVAASTDGLLYLTAGGVRFLDTAISGDWQERVCWNDPAGDLVTFTVERPVQSQPQAESSTSTDPEGEL